MGFFSELDAEGPYRTCGEAEEDRRWYPEEYAIATQKRSSVSSVNLETIMNTLTNAGFIVDAVYPYVIVSLKNRAVNTIEVALVLNVEPSSLLRSGNSVLVKC